MAVVAVVVVGAASAVVAIVDGAVVLFQWLLLMTLVLLGFNSSGVAAQHSPLLSASWVDSV